MASEKEAAERIVKQLRALARAEHDDLSIGDEAADVLEASLSRVEELEGALTDILDYRGGADSALNDEYVMDRARAALTPREPT